MKKLYFKLAKQTYFVLNSCANCKHVFIFKEYDCGDTYYCNIENDRPLCGSVALNENFAGNAFGTKDDEKIYYKSMKKWDKWEEKHKVEACGKCDYWNHEI